MRDAFSKDEFTYYDIQEALKNNNLSYLFKYFDSTDFNPNDPDISPIDEFFLDMERLKEIYLLWEEAKNQQK